VSEELPPIFEDHLSAAAAAAATPLPLNEESLFDFMNRSGSDPLAYTYKLLLILL
jgi:hypothetical protein